MEAHWIRLAIGLAAVSSMGAQVRSPNFTVTAPTEEIAQQVAQHAEHHRHRLAIAWVGYELKNWYAPCPIKVKVGQMGAGGLTSFTFERGASGEMEVFGWNMVVQGSLERILDSVIPHEVSHTIFACHFRRPLPRWADEGAATLAEHESEKRRQTMMARQILQSSRRIPFCQLLDTMEYPADPQAVLGLYAQAYTLAELLVQKGGRPKYLRFLADADKQGWDRALSKHYGYQSVDALEQYWKRWIDSGSPNLNETPQTELLVNNRRVRGTQDSDLVVRSQSPEPPQVAERTVSNSLGLKSTRLVAPRPKTALRTKRRMKNNDTPKVAAAAMQTVEEKKDSRYSNDGWIAVRTSGRAVAAMATVRDPSSRKNDRRPSQRTLRKRRPRRRLGRTTQRQIDSVEMSEVWPGDNDQTENP